LLNISRNFSRLPRFARFSKYSNAERAATFSTKPGKKQKPAQGALFRWEAWQVLLPVT